MLKRIMGAKSMCVLEIKLHPSIFLMEDGCVLSVRIIISVEESSAIDAINSRLNKTSMGNLNISSKRAIL